MRKILDMLRRKKATDKKSTGPFAASKSTAAAIQRNDDPLSIAIMHDLTLDSYDSYPVPSFVSPPSTPSAPAAPEASSSGWSTDTYVSSDSGSSSDSSSSSSDGGGYDSGGSGGGSD